VEDLNNFEYGNQVKWLSIDCKFNWKCCSCLERQMGFSELYMASSNTYIIEISLVINYICRFSCSFIHLFN